MYKFSQRSVTNLIGVHPELIIIATKALERSTIDFGITEGRRTLEKQKLLMAEGKSTTLNSRHLTGNAIDIAAYLDGQINWNFELYSELADTFKHVAKDCGFELEWGGDWTTFKDGVHFQRPW